MGGRSLVEGGVVIDVHVQQVSQPSTLDLVWLQPDTGVEGTHDVQGIQKHVRRTRKVKFTCNLCRTSNTKRINPHAWTTGSVFARCSGCMAVHKLRDNLEVFCELGNAAFPPPALREAVLGRVVLERAERIWRDSLRN